MKDDFLSQINNYPQGNSPLEALNQDYITQAAIRQNEINNVQQKVWQVEDATHKLKEFLDSYDRACAIWPEGMTASFVITMADYINKHMYR